jgi:hypothetical protein
MDAAVDLRPSYRSFGAYGLKAPTVWAQVDGVGPFRLRYHQVLRIDLEPGDHVVAVWATTLAASALGLAHATLHLGPGRAVGLAWSLPTALFAAADLVATPVGPAGGYAPIEAGPIPSGLGPCWVRPPHGSEPLGPVVPAPPYTAGLATPPGPPIPAPRPVAVGGWHPDPAGRVAHRWWDGGRWTAAVSDGTTTWEDPI